MEALKRSYQIIFPNDFLKELEKSIEGSKNVLDLGCGSSSPIKSFSKKLYCVGVDAFEPSIEKSKTQGIHNKYYKIDVLDIGKKFGPNSFDCVLALDLIEHFQKKKVLN